MKTLALDRYISDQQFDLVNQYLHSDNLGVTCTIRARYDEVAVQDLDDPELYLRIRRGVVRDDAPARRHRKHRINKKWFKRYGMIQVVDYTEVTMRVMEKQINSQLQTIDFLCMPHSKVKHYTVKW